MSVLIVEDRQVEGDRYVNWLLAEGYKATHVLSAEEAIDSVKKSIPDIMVVDVQLGLGEYPEGGIELMEEIKKEYDIPFLYFSGIQDLFKKGTRGGKTEPDGLINKLGITKEELAYNIELVLHNRGKKGKAAPLPVKDTVYIRCSKSGKGERVKQEEIAYLQAGGGASTNVFCINKSGVNEHKFSINLSIGDVENKLGFSDLLRINRKYMINKTHVSSVIGWTVFINGKEIEKGVSDKFCPNFKDIFKVL